MVKVIVGLIVIGGIALALVYYAGGVSTFDPTQQGLDAKAKMKVGMSWTKIVDIAEPTKYQILIIKKTTDPFGNVLETREPSQKMPFDFDLIKSDLSRGKLPNGFVLEYFFSNRCAFCVWFDGQGQAESIRDIKTIADLLDG